MRPGDEKTAVILGFQEELTGLGLLPKEPGGPVLPLSQPGPVPVALCGSPSAYRRHVRHGEPVDEACEAAERERLNKLRVARRARAREAA